MTKTANTTPQPNYPDQIIGNKPQRGAEHAVNAASISADLRGISGTHPAAVAQQDPLLLAMHLRQRAKLVTAGSVDALSENAANVLAAQQERIEELERYQAAFNEWHDKTEWVQKTAKPKELGKHRADVLRERIEALPSRECLQQSAEVLPLELRGVKEEIENGRGFWRSCSGCHETNEGHATGPVSKVFGCALGNGCSECGGIGAVWDDTDYNAMANAALQAAPPAPAGVAVPAEDEGTLFDYAMFIAHERELHVTGHKHDSDGAVLRFRSAVRRALAAAPAQAAFAPSFANGVLHSTTLHKLWDEAGEGLDLERRGALAWQLGVFAGKVAQAAAAPAQAVAVPTERLVVAASQAYCLLSSGLDLSDAEYGIVTELAAAIGAAHDATTAPAQEHATQLAGQGPTFAQWWDEQRKTAAERAPGDDWMDLNADDRDQYEAAFSAGKKSAAHAQAQEDARDPALLERLAVWCDEQAKSDWYGRRASDMVRRFAALAAQGENNGR